MKCFLGKVKYIDLAKPRSGAPESFSFVNSGNNNHPT